MANVKRKDFEGQLQQVAMEYLIGLEVDHEIFSFHIPNGGYRGARTGAVLKRQGVRAGVVDICVMAEPDAYRQPRVIWIELKYANGKQSKAQKAFEEVCDRLGHAYYLVSCKNVWEVQPAFQAILMQAGFLPGGEPEDLGAGVAEPHTYSPDYQAMGDCRTCGRVERDPIHE